MLLWEILPKKGSAYLERDNDTDRLQKSVYIHTFVFTSTYTSPFCHNPVESCPILLDSSRMDVFLQESVGHQKVQKFGRDTSQNDIPGGQIFQQNDVIPD